MEPRDSLPGNLAKLLDDLLDDWVSDQLLMLVG
jgi:hypothetical protein